MTPARIFTPDLAPPTSTETEPLSVRRREAARLLGVSERTIDAWIATGKIPFKKVGRTVLFSVDALREWITATN